MQKIVNNTHNKKIPYEYTMYAFTLVYNNIKSELTDYCRRARFKESLKQRKLISSFSFKWLGNGVLKRLLCYELVVKLFCVLECRLSEEACKLGQLCSSEQCTHNIW